MLPFSRADVWTVMNETSVSRTVSYSVVAVIRSGTWAAYNSSSRAWWLAGVDPLDHRGVDADRRELVAEVDETAGERGAEFPVPMTLTCIR
jgi:hypothetical protein